MLERGFIKVDVVPDGVTPTLVESADEALRFVNTTAPAGELHMSDAVKPGTILPPQLMTVDYREWLGIRTCGRTIGLASFNGHLEARIGMWNGIYLASEALQGSGGRLQV